MTVVAVGLPVNVVGGAGPQRGRCAVVVRRLWVLRGGGERSTEAADQQTAVRLAAWTQRWGFQPLALYDGLLVQLAQDLVALRAAARVHELL